MLDTKTIQKINDFVYAKPRTIQEISLLIKKNWRTADKYVQKIIEDTGSLAMRTFREGTRGALKIVFYNNIEKIYSSEVQERLLIQIVAKKNKDNFSPSEIYQFVSPRKKKLRALTDKAFYSKENFESFANLLKSANSQILFFSGNLTFSNQRHHDKTIRNIVEDLAARGVSSKILTRVEIPGINNIKNILAINRRVGKNMVEVRHCYHPLRLTIIDNKVAILKERLHPKNYEKDELPEKLHIFYYIYDQEWIEWMQKVFWKLFRASIDADKRIKDFSNMKIIR